MSAHPPPSQLSPHGGERAKLPGRYGEVAALRGPEPREPIATVLLLPGYTGSKEDFAPLLDGIAGAGFLPIAVDLPGQYESPGPDDESRYLPAALGEVAAELVALVAGDGLPVLLLGHSFGGLVARGAVLAGAPVSGLTLMASGPARLPDGHRFSALLEGDPILRGKGLAAAYKLREYVYASQPGWALVDPALKAFLRERFVASSQAGLLGMSLGLRTEEDRVDELAAALARRDVPGLVVTGEHDDAWSVPEQRAMAERLGAEFALVDGAGHSPNTENPPGLLDALLPRWRGWAAQGRECPGEF